MRFRLLNLVARFLYGAGASVVFENGFYVSLNLSLLKARDRPLGRPACTTIESFQFDDDLFDLARKLEGYFVR